MQLHLLDIHRFKVGWLGSRKADTHQVLSDRKKLCRRGEFHPLFFHRWSGEHPRIELKFDGCWPGEADTELEALQTITSAIHVICDAQETVDCRLAPRGPA